MIGSLLLAALLLAPASLVAPAAPIEPLRVVFVASEEGDYSEAQQAAILERVQRAVDFWRERAPEPVAAQAQAAGLLAAPADLGAWIADLSPHQERTIYVVYNEVTRRPLPGGRHGGASYAMRFAIVTSAHPLDPEALLAHELGHLLYNVPNGCPDFGSDIMCNQTSAYRLGRLGCFTLEQLGRPCWRVALVMVR